MTISDFDLRHDLLDVAHRLRAVSNPAQDPLAIAEELLAWTGTAADPPGRAARFAALRLAAQHRLRVNLDLESFLTIAEQLLAFLNPEDT